MAPSFLSHTYFSKKLDEAIENVSPERNPLIENFLYEKSALLIYADDGSGKSVLTLQACMQSTVQDSKVFGEFFVSRPCKILYFQMERSPDESFERMKRLRHAIPFSSDNFCLSLDLIGTDLQDPSSAVDALSTVYGIVSDIGYIPDIIAFDPIYPLVRDDLSFAPPCNAITRFFRTLQLLYDCSIFATSHTNRGERDQETHKRVGQDMYGNRFLSAFFTGSYHLIIKEDGAGSILRLNKNSQKNLEKKIDLVYDASNYRSWTVQEGIYTKKDKLDNFLKTCKLANKEFSFADMIAISEVSDSTLRGYLAGYLREKLETSTILKQGKKLYRYLG